MDLRVLVFLHPMQGSSLVVFGPTLLDVASHLSVSVGSLALMFAVRALGGAIGSMGSGFVMDRLEKFSYTVLSGILLADIASEFSPPLWGRYGGLTFCFHNGYIVLREQG